MISRIGGFIARFVTLMLAVSAGAVRAEPALQPQFGPSFERRVDAVLRNAHVPGAVVVVVQDGQLRYAKGWGHQDIAHRIAIDPERSIFRLASVSKVFIWMSLVQLAVQGRVDLDAPVARYLPTYAQPNARWRPLRVRDLMAHAAGFEDEGLGTVFLRRPEDRIPLDAFLARHVQARVRPPGEVAVYSNYAAALGALLVERVSGEPYARYVERHIFAPLSMRSATLNEPLPPALRSRLVQGYRWVDDQGYVPGAFEYVGNWGPAGAMSASGLDMAQAMNALLGLSAQSAFTPVMAATMGKRVLAIHPALPGVAHGLFETRLRGRPALEHGGDIELFHTQLVLVPESRIGIFIAFSSFGGVTARPAVLDAVAAQLFPKELPAQGVSPQTLLPPVDIVGEYGSARQNRTTIAKAMRLLWGGTTNVSIRDGLMHLTEAGDASIWRYAGDNLFVRRDGHGLMALIRDSDGQVYLSKADDTSTPIYKLDWRDGTALNLGLMGTAIVAAALLLGLGLVSLCRRGSWRLYWMCAVLVPVSVGSFALLAAYSWREVGIVALYTAIPPSLKIATLTPFILIAALMGLFSLAAFARHPLSPVERAAIVLGMVVAVTALPFASNWNAIGWHFG